MKGEETMTELLSYPIKQGEATWPGNPSVSFTPFESMEKGNLANTGTIHLFNHYGTHMDAPYHFVRDGLKIAEVPFERFIFKHPLLLDVKMEPEQMIEVENLESYAQLIGHCDLLMLRTGMGKIRDSEPEIYSAHGPAVSSVCSRWLMDNFPNLKAVALDFVSLASYAHPEDGPLTHRIMLGQEHDHYVLIIEDVNMKELRPDKLGKIYAIPLLIEGIDSCPVTMWME